MKQSTTPKHPPATDPEAWVDLYGNYLYRFALATVKDPAVAEELVQETFLGALRSRKAFERRSSERTWLTVILKHKIVDHFRSQTKRVTLEYQDDRPAEFTSDGRWSALPAKWSQSPVKLLEQKEFLDVLYRCLSELPDRQSKTFMFRVIDGLSTDELCKALDITATNSWVLLYRARMGLRRCLDVNWFDRTGDET